MTYKAFAYKMPVVESYVTAEFAPQAAFVFLFRDRYTSAQRHHTASHCLYHFTFLTSKVKPDIGRTDITIQHEIFLRRVTSHLCSTPTSVSLTLNMAVF